MNRTLRIYNKDGIVINYASDRLGNYPEDLDAYLKLFPDYDKAIIKEGNNVIQEKTKHKLGTKKVYLRKD